MKQRKRWMAVLTVWTIALLFAAGFTSQASVSGSEMIQEKKIANIQQGQGRLLLRWRVFRQRQ